MPEVFIFEVSLVVSVWLVQFLGRSFYLFCFYDFFVVVVALRVFFFPFVILTQSLLLFRPKSCLWDFQAYLYLQSFFSC